MADTHGKPLRLDQAVTWLSFAMLAGAAAAFAWYVPRDREAILQIYADFGVRLPQSAAAVCAVPTAAIAALAAAMVVVALIVQVRSGSPRSAALFHLLLTIGLGLLFLGYQEAMGDAAVALLRELSG